MAEPAHEKLTFLLTDVEESTALWEASPAAMHRALARHDEIFDEAVLVHQGDHIRPRGEGDSRFAVFRSAPNAVTAAVAMQRAIAAEVWHTPRPVRVRIGIHTGDAERRAGDYYGTAVNLCARLRSLGHGGQILLSEATTNLIRHHLSPGTRLIDLGEHHLRGLSRTERIHHLVAPGLPAEFPPLLGTKQHPHNLPTPPTSLIGRDRDVRSVRDLLGRDEVRLVTLTGAGGVGKTRIGLQVAAELVTQFPDGVFLVPLATIRDPVLVTSTIAQAIGVRETAGRSIHDTLTDYLRDRRLLLVLDNFEHLLSAAPIVADVLEACPDVNVLVTSRAVLRLRGEREYAVLPLDCPDPTVPSTLDTLAHYSATALFVRRVSDVLGDFPMTGDHAPAAAEICRRVDGLPLGIELAAARVRVLLPQAMLSRLGRRLPLLTGGARDLPERQQTLHATIAWSYDLLAQAEQCVFRRLSVFEGGCTLEAAEAVCGADDDAAISVLDSIEALIGQSLLRRYAGPNGEPRFRMLETIREYARDRLDASAESHGLQRRHAEYFLGLAERADAHIRSADQSRWLAQLEAEHDNLRAALTWSRLRADSLETAIRLAGALASFWWLRGYFDEGRRWLHQICFETPDSMDADHALLAARAKVLDLAGVLAHHQGELSVAAALFEQTLTLARRANDRLRIAWAHQHLGLVDAYRGRFESARLACTTSVTMQRERRDTHGVAIALVPSAIAEWYAGDLTKAVAFAEESVALFQSLGDHAGIAYAQRVLGAALWRAGDTERARLLCTESLNQFRTLENVRGMAIALLALAPIISEDGDVQRATVLYQECMQCFQDVGDRWGMVSCLEAFTRHRIQASISDRRELVRATSLLGAVEILRETIDAPVPEPDRPEGLRVVAALSHALGDDTFVRAWQSGRSTTLEQAVADALAWPDSPR